MDNNTERPKFETQRRLMSRNKEIVQEWIHRYREGKKPVTLADLAIRYGLSKNRIYAIIQRYGKDAVTENTL